MKRKSIVASLVFALLLPASTAIAAGHVSWGYTGKGGPEYWGTLDPKFAVCSAGKNQSPINLTGMIEADLTPMTVRYQPGGHEILNNGHTIQVNYVQGNTLTLDSHEFELKQFHFHSPSENTIEGESYPLEAHFVHADKNGNLAVVALMFKIGGNNDELEKAWKQMPGKADQKNALSQNVDAAALLPGNRDYYRFNGSLTTPPCSEGVRWLVLKDMATVSKEQVKTFSDVMHHPNNRPVQPVNARTILQ